ncbi:NUDIX domain-containing protein [Thioalbus denitrificans]|uniref:NUDIX domain-containing protein n=1 Tax=Thioalbus denitrificans TaxID=547122 RepID=A0A369CA37_9GAMM|nr:NUDIX domain-containing protein [Thioalbus denitrificans]RCX30759.1 NUDIX domain-containing protein [Thioalbus denitrificans]
MAAGSPERRHVVTAFLRHGDRVLLVRRSGRVGTYQGLWSGISGYLEDADPLDQARREVEEETGIPSAVPRLVSAAPPLEIEDAAVGRCWVVHPFLFEVDDPDAVRLDWENLELRWVRPADLGEYATVPALAEALAACLEREAAGG